MNDDYYMQQALREAQKAFEEDEIPIGCIIVINKKIIARAHNMTEQLNDSTAHAEILALTSAYNFLGSKYLPDATLYVTIEPCLMCAGAMYWSKLERVVWGASDEKNGFRHITENNSPFHPKTKIRTGVLKNECAELIKTFFQQKR
ncbi:MAG TPA: nucleoside deaminase [Parafilimonas sp.]|nr:nucleoside deaminase [Parafilimonas sp.]